MDFQQIRYFLAAASQGSLTRAADHCNVTQPALTRSIRRLEDELGGTLFDRDASGAQLTRFGHSVMPFLEDTLRASEAARLQARSFLDDDARDLGLGLAPNLPADRLLAPLAEMRRRLGDFRVRLAAAPGPALIERLEDGAISVAVLDGPPDAVPERLRAWPLLRRAASLAVAPDHPLATLARVPLARLADMPLIDRPEAVATRRLKAALAAAGVAAQWAHSADGEAQSLALVAGGFGAAVVEGVATPPGVAVRPLADLEVPAVLSLVTVAGRPFNPPTDLFVRLARSRDWQAALAGEAGEG